MWFFLPLGLGKITYGLKWSETISLIFPALFQIKIFDFPAKLRLWTSEVIYVYLFHILL